MSSVLLKIVLVYSDVESARLGSEVTTSLRKELGRRFQVVQSVWKTELLKSPGLRNLAADEARESNVVIVAASEEVPLPDELREWFDLWRNRNREVPGAFVALLHQEVGNGDRAVVQGLREMAKEAHMEFFCHSGAETGWGGGGGDLAGSKIHGVGRGGRPALISPCPG